jgi:hypothetical protein
MSVTPELTPTMILSGTPVNGQPAGRTGQQLAAGSEV